MNQFLGIWSGQVGITGVAGGLTLLAIVIWTFVWKGLALWRAAREESRWWFIVLLVVNTLGILEILYLFFFSKRARRTAQSSSEKDPAADPAKEER